MKKVIMFLCVMAVCVGCYAYDAAITEYSYCIENTTDVPITFVIPTTSIVPNVAKLTGYVAYPGPEVGQNNTETFIGIFDDTTTLMTGEKLGEKEAGDRGSCGDRFARPKKIFNGIVVRIGAHTEGIIFFTNE